MAFSINDFASKALKFGGARNTLFSVALHAPTGGLTNGGSLNNLSEFLVESTTIPQSAIQPIEISYMGRKIKIAGDRTFDMWGVTILNDEDFAIRKIMEEWHNKINSLEGNLNTFGSTEPSNYKANATVKQYSKNGPKSNPKILRSYTFKNMFPIEITQIELDWAATDQVEKFQVTFAYDWYEIDSKNEGGDGSGPGPELK